MMLKTRAYPSSQSNGTRIVEARSEAWEPDSTDSSLLPRRETHFHQRTKILISQSQVYLMLCMSSH